MSKSAGTLITTHNATYIPPRFMPGYRGVVPTMKFDYGETYGNHSAKYFQDFRSKALETSKSNYCKGGMFPTYYTYNPDYALDARSRTWDRWEQAPRYRLTHLDYDGKEQLINFDKRARSHRDNYKDKSGELPRVDYFVLPTKSEDMLKKNLPFMTLSHRYTDDINLPTAGDLARVEPIYPPRKFLGRTTRRERAMRDTCFQSR